MSSMSNKNERGLKLETIEISDIQTKKMANLIQNRLKMLHRNNGTRVIIHNLDEMDIAPRYIGITQADIEGLSDREFRIQIVDNYIDEIIAHIEGVYNNCVKNIIRIVSDMGIAHYIDYITLEDLMKPDESETMVKYVLARVTEFIYYYYIHKDYWEEFIRDLVLDDNNHIIRGVMETKLTGEQVGIKTLQIELWREFFATGDLYIEALSNMLKSGEE